MKAFVLLFLLASVITAVQSQPTSQSIRARGLTLRDQKKYAEALAIFDSAIVADPMAGCLYGDRAYTKYYLHDSIGAVNDIDAAVGLCPNDPDIFCTRGMIKMNLLHDLRGAVADFTLALRLDAWNSRAYYFRGCAKHLLHELTAADYDLCLSIKLYSNSAMAYRERAWVRYELGNTESFCVDFRAALGCIDVFQHPEIRKEMLLHCR